MGKKKKKYQKIPPRHIRKIWGLHLLGKSNEDICKLLMVNIKEVEKILAARPKIRMSGASLAQECNNADLHNTNTKAAQKTKHKLPCTDIVALLQEIGEEKLSAIIKGRAEEVRKFGHCLD